MEIFDVYNNILVRKWQGLENKPLDYDNLLMDYSLKWDTQANLTIPTTLKPIQTLFRKNQKLLNKKIRLKLPM